MKYQHLVDACVSDQQRADLCFILALASAGSALLGEERLETELRAMRDAVMALSLQINPNTKNQHALESLGAMRAAARRNGFEP